MIAAKFKFIQSHCDHLESVMVHFKLRSDTIFSEEIPNELIQSQWVMHQNYLQGLLEMIDDGAVYSGYLEWNGPFAPYHKLRKVSGTKAISMLWDQANIAESLAISQLITRIHTSVWQHNSVLCPTDYNERKLILNLPELKLYPKHEQFLKCWFDDCANNFFDCACGQFVMT